MHDDQRQPACQEAISIRVGRLLESKGFCPASSLGVACKTLVDTDSVGILYAGSDTKTKRRLFGLISTEPRRLLIGVIWFSNRLRGANINNLVFEVNGHNFVEPLKQLATEVATAFNVKTELYLVNEEPEIEFYQADIK